MDCRELLAEIRRTGLTQAEVAEKLGIRQASVSKLERGLTKELRAGAYSKLLALYGRISSQEVSHG
ncbi:MAG: helix-turn-helix domain-containing protein [Comamonas sp.]|jgi:transcriptional regulator with XRE-family HTH domain|uniref:helix-turn-helix domain-containing protein n=1 Tax=Comamonas sp. TaxID=34028 RepID=UPI00283377D9|nr:helix-turn-helix domain-containing protein [Comamonas sp.]MDR0214568.1 helix-turn-helix domain-containing protein [Comamonas sp.]